MDQSLDSRSFLTAADPEPYELVNTGRRSSFVLTCEHAGRAVPRSIGTLGISDEDFDRHVTYDVGADGVARRLAEALDAPLVLQPYSRLVIDCNRPFVAHDCVPEVSDGTEVPPNRGLDEAARRTRFDAIHEPFHGQVSNLLDAAPSGILIAVHSFTPRLRMVGRDRPWHAGLLFNRDRAIADMLMPALAALEPDRTFALNEPYTIDDLSDYTVPVHGEGRGIAHVLIEIRNDLISDDAGQELWADIFARALKSIEPHAVSEAQGRDTS